MVNEIISRIKNEILIDVENKVVPASCKSFDELGNYVNAGKYGGLRIDDEFSHEGKSDEEIDAIVNFVYDVQRDIGEWLKRGGILDEVHRLQGDQHKSSSPRLKL